MAKFNDQVSRINKQWREQQFSLSKYAKNLATDTKDVLNYLKKYKIRKGNKKINFVNSLANLMLSKNNIIGKLEKNNSVELCYLEIILFD